MKILRSPEQRYNLSMVGSYTCHDIYKPVNQFLLITKTNNSLDSVENSLLDDQKM